MEKNQIIELKITDMLDDGRAFGRFEGCAVFVSGGAAHASGKGIGRKVNGAVPGDLIKAKITKAKKASAEAMMTELVEASHNRIEAECPYAAECGGCTLQELSYEAQLELKREQVRSKLERLGGLTDPMVNEMIGAERLRYYRNKAVFAIGPHGEVGFKKAKSNYVLDIDDCMLQTDAAMVCADALRAFLKSGDSAIPVTQMTVKTAFGTGEVMVVLESRRKDIPGIEKLVEMMDDAVYSLGFDEEGEPLAGGSPYSLESVAVVYGADAKKGRPGKCFIAAGKPTITDEVMLPGGVVKFEVSPQSFYQVNPEQMVRLYEKAAEYAGIMEPGADGQMKTVLDLYCGVGTIGIYLAKREEQISGKRSGSRVIGIESVKPAIIDANRNSVINGLINTRYICGKAEEELPGMMGLAKLYKWNEVNERVEREPEIRLDKVDAVVLDPPRAGCDEALLAAVVKAQPERIVYVSCDPGTLARDIKYLSANGYEFIEATPVDQFPWTSSIEAVVKIQRSK